MRIIEFRIPMPVTVSEFKVAQLYMVAKNSKLHTKDGEGIEILKNEPFEDENGKGQYTYKIYHIASKYPSWLRSIVPKSATELEERAWNAYPYCKTILTCPFFGAKMELLIETHHVEGLTEVENVMKLPDEELEKRHIEYIDVADELKDKKLYKEAEDPKLFVSTKTGKGPLPENWMKDPSIVKMTVYKMVKIRFDWGWGLTSSVEKFVHTFEKNLFQVSHRQAYTWIDEWYGMTIEDIRKMEHETANEVNQKLPKGEDGAVVKEETMA